MSKNIEPKITEMQIRKLEKLGAEAEEEFKSAMHSFKIVNNNVIKMSNIFSKIRKTNH
jgi:hypothetical protein